MSLLFNTSCYQKSQALRRACLFNLRDNDLHHGGSIRQGEIVAGRCGYVVAETNVPGFTGTVQPYWPNRCVLWREHFLTCMALPGLPTGPVPRGSAGGLRHQHYVVAEFADPAAITEAKKQGLPLVRSLEGRLLANVEIAIIPGKKNRYRAAQLL